LNLTVAPDAKERAKELAKKTRRSLSSLFETLVDEEWERTHGGIEEQPDSAYGKIEEKPADEGRKKIGFRDSLKSQPIVLALSKLARKTQVAASSHDGTEDGTKERSMLHHFHSINDGVGHPLSYG
jgi:hypothetical protein